MADSQLASNNPFRRKDPIAAAVEGQSSSTPAPEANSSNVDHVSDDSPLQTSSHQFREQLRALPKSSEALPSTSFRKPKPVKKVRVQSPPPSSPSSPDSTHADFEARFPASGPPDEHHSSESSDVDDVDPFQSAAEAENPVAANSTQTASPAHRPPPNPFQKTLKDLEQNPKEEAQIPTGGAAASTPTGKGSLDVNSFRRLLLTGQSGVPPTSTAPPTSSASPQPTPQPAVASGDAGSLTDASSISRQSIFDAAHPPQETPRTSHEISDAEDEHSGLISTPQAPSQRTTLRKKPPPPSSRHGKLIQVQQQQGRDTTPKPGPAAAAAGSVYSSTRSGRPSSSSSDLNKPLPEPPARRGSLDEDPESVFDREAAGKIPEVDIDPDAPDEAIPAPRPPTPPNASHSTSTPSGKKPLPPPRRHGHGSKNPAVAGSEADDGAEDLDFRRSSFESNRSRSSSIKLSIHAPTPPPPRRPNHTSRPSNSFTSPSALSFSSMASSASSPSAVSDADRSPLGWAAPQGQGASIAGAMSPNRETSGAAHSKLSPPQPPPARGASVRHKEGRGAAENASATASGRPPSVSSIDAPSRRISRENMAPPPPPPPPRQRGGSRGSSTNPGTTATDAAGGGGRRASVESVRITGDHTAIAEEPEDAGESSKDILADLDRLQREVDAYRGVVKTGRGTGPDS